MYGRDPNVCILYLKLVFLIVFNLVVWLRLMNYRFNCYDFKIYIMQCNRKCNAIENQMVEKIVSSLWCDITVKYNEMQDAIQVRLRVCLYKLLQNSVLGLKWMFIKKLWEVTTAKQNFVFQNSLFRLPKRLTIQALNKSYKNGVSTLSNLDT